MSFTDEAERILEEYRRRKRDLPADYYSLARPGVLFAYQQRVRATLRALAGSGFLPLSDRHVLEIGCGTGSWLVDLESWGARRGHLAAIELDPERAAEARARVPGADVRVGDACNLPWPDRSFDLVLQSTVMSSILDSAARHRVAAEMRRVVRPEGAILWYDFFLDNPANPNVRGVRRSEILELFPGFQANLQRITLAPPLARWLAPRSWLASLALERLGFLNTHYLGVLIPSR